MNGAACMIPNHAIRGYLQKNCASIDKQVVIACGCSNRSAFEENSASKQKISKISCTNTKEKRITEHDEEVKITGDDETQTEKTDGTSTLQSAPDKHPKDSHIPTDSIRPITGDSSKIEENESIKLVLSQETLERMSIICEKKIKAGSFKQLKNSTQPKTGQNLFDLKDIICLIHHPPFLQCK